MKTLVLQSGLVVLFDNSLLNHISSRNQFRIRSFGPNSYILIIGSGTRLVKTARNQLGLWLRSGGARHNRSSNSGSLSALNKVDFRSDPGRFLTSSFFGLRDLISIGHLGIHDILLVLRFLVQDKLWIPLIKNHFWRLFLLDHLRLVSWISAYELVIVHEALRFHMMVIYSLRLAIVSELRAINALLLSNSLMAHLLLVIQDQLHHFLVHKGISFFVLRAICSTDVRVVFHGLAAHMQSISGHHYCMGSANHNFLLTHLLRSLMIGRSHILLSIVIVIKHLAILVGFDRQSWMI